VVKIKKFNCRLEKMGSQPWPFGVTRCHRSRDHSARDGQLPMGGTLWPCIYLALLWRYGASKVGRMHSRMNRRTLRWFYTLSKAMHGIGQTKVLNIYRENHTSQLDYLPGW